jgi:hypothetical protein
MRARLKGKARVERVPAEEKLAEVLAQYPLPPDHTIRAKC